MASVQYNITPIFRIFDERKAREFYHDYLGFTVDWEHRYEENFPLYMQVSRDGFKLHLSEHYGDCTPGSSVRVEVQGIHEFHQQLADKNYKYLKPGLEDTPWGAKECTITDPFGNRIVFYENLGG